MQTKVCFTWQGRCRFWSLLDYILGGHIWPEKSRRDRTITQINTIIKTAIIYQVIIHFSFHQNIMDPNVKIPITHKANFHNHHQLHHNPQHDHDQTDLNTKILVRQSLILFADVPFAKANLHPMSLRAETWIIAIIAMNHRHNHNGTQIRNLREK